jgi:hypothetical protein
MIRNKTVAYRESAFQEVADDIQAIPLSVVSRMYLGTQRVPR